MSTPPHRFAAWVERLFQAPERLHEERFLQVEHVRLVSHLFRNLAAEIAPYDNEQVRRGIEHIVWRHLSDIPAAILGNSCPLEERLACLEAAAALCCDCFEVRCEPVLSHLNEPHRERLAGTCYMLWDASALLHWPDGREAMLSVLQAGLDCGNPACRESALHGLGHLARDEPRVAGFLERGGATMRPELAASARRAQAGLVP